MAAHAEIDDGAVLADAEIAVGHRVQHAAQFRRALRDDALQLELAVFQRARGQALGGEVEVRRDHQVLAADGHAHRGERRVEDVAAARAERGFDVAHLAVAFEHVHGRAACLDVDPGVELQPVVVDGLVRRVAEHRDEAVVDLDVALVLVARQAEAGRTHAKHRGETRLAVAQRRHGALALLGQLVAFERAADVFRQALEQRELARVEELDRRRVHREHAHRAAACLQRIGRRRPVAERQRAVAPRGHGGIGADVGGVHRAALAERPHAGRQAERALGQRRVRRVEVGARLAGPGHRYQLAGLGVGPADPGHAQAAVVHHDLADRREQRLGRALARDRRVHVGEHLVEAVQPAQVAFVVATLRHVAADAQHARELAVRAEHRRVQRFHQLLVAVVRVGQRELVRHRRPGLDRALVGRREFGGHGGRQEGAGRVAEQLVLGRADEALEPHVAGQEPAVQALEPDEVGQRVDQRAQAPRLAVDLGRLLAHRAPQRQAPQHRDDRREGQRQRRHDDGVQPARADQRCTEPLVLQRRLLGRRDLVEAFLDQRQRGCIAAAHGPVHVPVVHDERLAKALRRVGAVQVVLGRRAVHAEDLRAAGDGCGDQALVAGIGVDQRDAAGAQAVDADVARQRGHVEAAQRTQVDQALDAALGVDRLAHVGERRGEVQRAGALGRPEESVDDVGIAAGDSAQRVRPVDRLEVDVHAGLLLPQRPFVGYQPGRAAVLVAEQVGRIALGTDHAQRARRQHGGRCGTGRGRGG